MERLTPFRFVPSLLILGCLTFLLLPTFATAGDIEFQKSGVYVDGVRCGTYTPSPEETEQNAAAIAAWREAGGRTAGRRADVVIPIAYHVVAHDDGFGDVPDAQIYDQMSVLNAAYSGTGFSFSLASIDRTYNTRWSTHRYGSSNERKMKQALAIDPATTFNIYLCNIGGGLLGYATFPDMYPEDSYMHGVVALYSTLPGGTAAPYNEGDTITHEAGHFVGLYHTFQGGCSEPNDYCDDTPQEASPAYGCPDGRDSCPSDPGLDPIHNFMDYVDDYCMWEFTTDQAARANEQMALFRPTMYGGTIPTGPVAAFSGSPTSGDVPLTVVFTDESTGSPTSWSWTFGDGGSDNVQNPTYTYNTVGTYTVTLTVANVDGSDALTRTDYITVTEPGTGGNTMYVSAMTVGRKVAGPNNNGTCSVSVVDDGGAAVDGATVTVTYDGPNSGTLSGTTSGGSVNFSTPKVKNPVGEWCFEVTGVTHAALTYDPGANVTTRSCESGDVYRVAPPQLTLRNEPNPFNPTTVFRFALEESGHTVLRVYDLRGRIVDTPLDRDLGPGWHEVTWNGRNQPSGTYFYQLKSGDVLLTRKMTILK